MLVYDEPTLKIDSIYECPNDFCVFTMCLISKRQLLLMIFFFFKQMPSLIFFYPHSCIYCKMQTSDGINLGLTGSTGEALALIRVFAFKRINKYINNVVCPTHISAVSSLQFHH